jgi:hypothetical protein
MAEDAACRPICFARRCYDHLAGGLGVALASAWERNGYTCQSPQGIEMTETGRQWLADNGFAIEAPN